MHPVTGMENNNNNNKEEEEGEGDNSSSSSSSRTPAIIMNESSDDSSVSGNEVEQEEEEGHVDHVIQETPEEETSLAIIPEIESVSFAEDEDNSSILLGIGLIKSAEDPASLPKDAETAQSTFLSIQKDVSLIPDAHYYLISKDWYSELTRWFTGIVESPPQAVNNDSLIIDGALGANLSEYSHYSILNEASWGLLMKWFGGGPEIKRRTYIIGSQVMIDIQGIHLRLIKSSNPTHEVRVTVAKYGKLSELTKLARKLLEIPSTTQLQVWDYFSDKYYQLFQQPSSPLANLNLASNQAIMFEEPDPLTGTFTAKVDVYRSSGMSSSAYMGGMTAYNPGNSLQNSSPPQNPGLVGLCNLGNTCFMNSMLQCLSNTPPLREYFLSGEYKQDINETNPLGMKGKLAESFGELLEYMWGRRGIGSLVAPRGFKTSIAQFKPDFSGYNQHDSQELLSFLLDGLHEDLNRVKNKPYTSGVEGNGRPDEIVAKESLDVFKLRNDSKLSDLFTGQFKSTVNCPVESCGNVSVTFDPYMCVQLPLTKETMPMQSAEVYFVDPETWSTNQRFKPIRVLVPKNGSCFQLRVKVAENLNIPVQEILIWQVSNLKLYSLLTDSNNLDRLMPSLKLYAYRVEHAHEILYRHAVDDCKTKWNRPLGHPYTGPLKLKNGEVVEQEGEQQQQQQQQLEEQEEENDEKALVEEEEIVSSSSSSSSDHGDFVMVQTEEIVANKYESSFWKVGDCFVGKYLVGINDRNMRIEVMKAKPILGKPMSQHVICVFDFGFQLVEGTFIVEGIVSLEPRATPGATTAISDDEFLETKFDLKYTGGWYGSYGETVATPSGFSISGSVHSSGLCLQGTVHSKGCSLLYGARNRRNGIDSAISCEDIEVLVHHVKSEQLRSYYMETIGVPIFFTVPKSSTQQFVYRECIRHLTLKASKGEVTTIPSSSNNDTTTDEIDSTSSTPVSNEFDPLGLESFLSIMISSSDFLHSSNDTLLDPNSLEPFVEENRHSEKLILRWDWATLGNSTSSLLQNLFNMSKSSYNSTNNQQRNNKNNNLNDNDASEEENEEENEDEGLTLNNCFDLFSATEQLSAFDTWYCSKCKEHRRAYKKIELWSTPPVLVLHLKRFSQEEHSHFVDKNDDLVKFPLNGLQLKERIAGFASPGGSDSSVHSEYDLVAVSNHFGGLGGGHYTAFCRLPMSKDWYEFDDSSVSKIPTSRVVSKAAYVLFYLRRDLCEKYANSESTPSTNGDLNDNTNDTRVEESF